MVSNPKKNAKPADAEAEEATGAATGEAEQVPQRRRFPGKKLVLFIIAPLMLLGGAGAGAYYAGLLSSVLGDDAGEAQEAAAETQKPTVFYNLPEMLVNLNTTGRRASFLKLSVSLELDNPADIPRIEAVMPRIVDNFQIYLRELRVEDLRGSTGLYRLREELLARVNNAAQPARINDVLFKEMLVQ